MDAVRREPLGDPPPDPARSSGDDRGAAGVGRRCGHRRVLGSCGWCGCGEVIAILLAPRTTTGRRTVRARGPVCKADAMDTSQQDFIETFRRFMTDVINAARPQEERATPLGQLVSEHLGTDASQLPLVTENIAGHRLVDADIALDRIASADAHARLIGVTGGQMRDHEDLPRLLKNPHAVFGEGPVDYVTVDTGPESTRHVVACGVHLLRFEGHPVAVMQRAARPRSGRDSATLEVLAPAAEVSSRLIAEVRRLMTVHSVLRGKVLSFAANPFGPGAAGVTFLPRPSVAEGEIVLAPGTLENVVSHVVGIGAHRDRLRERGQHLKRGVLLYGPPGTGKTLTVRHLLSRSDGVTSVLLTGVSIRFITEAAELARAMQPAIVVLEDVDLVAAERGMHGGPQPLLFAVLDALDGLDGDADVAFVLTTNRADVLEPALAQRPGRIDLAAEIPLPDRDSRRRLFALYADGLGLSDAVVERAADRAEGVTGSFAKELMRRTVLRAAQAGREVDDGDLTAALDDLLSDREQLTRALLGGSADGGIPGAVGGSGSDPHWVSRGQAGLS